MTGRSSVGAAFQLAAMLGVGRSGGIEKTSLISLTSEESRARPHMRVKWRGPPIPAMPLSSSAQPSQRRLHDAGQLRYRYASILGKRIMTTADDTFDFIVTGAGSAG